MRVTASAVSSETTRRVAAGGAAWNFPAPSTKPRTRRGWIQVPWFAMAAYTEIICSGVTATPWPTGMVPMLAAVQSPTEGRMPSTSPGNPTPVGWPSPNRARYWAMRRCPTRWASLIVPTLLDWAMMSAIVIDSTGCTCESWNTHSGHSSGSSAITSGTSNRSSGRTSPSSIAADAVMTLFTEPGSYTDTMAGFWSRAVVKSAKCDGSKLGYVAMARMSPVWGSMTITVPPLALFSLTASASASWTRYWISRSMVVTTSRPGTGGWSWFSPCGIRCPPGSTSSTRWPGVPVSSSWYWSSSPDRPDPSTPTNPTTWGAMAPLG